MIHQSIGERNFHIFYQLLAGADDNTLRKLFLKKNLDTFFYLSNGVSPLDFHTLFFLSETFLLFLSLFSTTSLLIRKSVS